MFSGTDERVGSEHLVNKLHKTLYGLRQASRTWFDKIKDYFLKEGFVFSPSENTLFISRKLVGRMGRYS